MEPNNHLATVYIAIKEPVFAKKIEEFLSGKSGILKTTKCHSLSELQKYALDKAKKILLLATDLPGISSINHIKEITRAFNAHTTALFCNDSNLDMINQLVKLNYNGYLLKTTDCDTVKFALTLLIKGKDYLDKAITKMILHFSSTNKIYNGVTFTNRQYDVLMLLKDRIRPAAIPDMLGITTNTYNEHRGGITKRIEKAGFADLKSFFDLAG